MIPTLTIPTPQPSTSIPPKVWLTFMTAAGNEENLRELVDPLLPYIDGVVAVVHRPCDNDPGYLYLESVKGKGKIIVRDWVQRHDVSQSETLYTGVIEDGDLFIITDTLERPIPSFISRCKEDLNDFMLMKDIDCLAYYGKPYIVRYNESLHYQGSPHWGLFGTKSGVELSTAYPDETQIRLNVRPLKRTNEFNWVEHYAKYGLYPAGSNAFLLGLDTYGNPSDLFPVREQKRQAFRKEIKKRGFSMDLPGLKAMLSLPLDDVLKTYLREEKVWSDYYHHVICGRTDVVHSHKPADAIPIL